MRTSFDWLEVQMGKAPLILSLPHTGSEIPQELQAQFISADLARKDTDWWVERLYDFAKDLDVTLIRTRISRSVIDVNRDPSGVSLYPGQTTTGLCPLTCFDGTPLYHSGREPSEQEIEGRLNLFFNPYHQAVTSNITRLLDKYQRILVYDAHAIASVIPNLFSGVLPHLNLGTNGGESCDVSLTRAIEALCRKSPYSYVTNGRFKGGYITRHYGKPASGVQALQMEIAFRSYLREDTGACKSETGLTPPVYEADLANPLKRFLSEIFTACLSRL